MLIYFAKDIWRITYDLVRGASATPRCGATLDYRMGWYVIIGSIPIGVFGFAVQGPDPHRRPQPVARRDHADRRSRSCSRSPSTGRPADPHDRALHAARRHRDGLRPGDGADPRRVPLRRRRSPPACFLGLTREAATRYSFLLAIPAVVMSGVFSLPDVFDPAPGSASTPSVAQMVVATRDRVRARVRRRSPGCCATWRTTPSTPFVLVPGGARLARARCLARPTGSHHARLGVSRRGGDRGCSAPAHGRTTANAAGGLAGRQPVELDDTGRAQADRGRRAAARRCRSPRW